MFFFHIKIPFLIEEKSLNNSFIHCKKTFWLGFGTICKLTSACMTIPVKNLNTKTHSKSTKCLKCIILNNCQLPQTTHNTGQQRKNTSEQQIPVLFLQTLLYTSLVSVSPGTKKFLRKIVLKFRKSSHLGFLKSTQREILSEFQISELYLCSD